MNEDPDVLRGLVELRRYKSKSKTTPEHRALHRKLLSKLGGFYAKNFYANSDYEVMQDAHSYPHFDAYETAEGERLLDSLHEDATWITYMYRRSRDA